MFHVLGSVRVCKYCNERHANQNQRMVNSTIGNASDAATFSTGGTATLGRHMLTAPNYQLSGSRGSLHSDPHSSASTPGVARHRLRTVSVFGSPAVGSPAANRNVDYGGDDRMGNSPINPSTVKTDKRQRKISAPSSLHPFDSPMEDKGNITPGSDINRTWSFSKSSQKRPRHSKKVYR